MKLSVAQAMESPLLFQPFFSGDSWATWRAVIKAAFCERMSAAETELFHSVADRDPPKQQVKEFIALAGRGAGKDSIVSLIATVLALNFNPKGRLRPGEKALVMCLACDRDQAQIVLSYIQAYFEQIPALKALVIGQGRDSIELSNGVLIRVTTNSYRAVRGRTLLAAIFDEVCFWSDENSAKPDVETHAAVTPGLARMKGSMLFMISSVHKRAGLAYQRWKRHYGKDKDDVLCVLGSTLQFNPSFDRALIDRSLEEDPERYGAEYLSQWRDDLTNFISRELLEGLVDRHVTVRPPEAGVSYICGCDASGGRGDSFTMAIAHPDKGANAGNVVLDLLYERKSPFSPSEVVHEVAQLMKQYRIAKVTGDNYSAEWVVDAFSKQGIRYEKSELARSEVYMCALPLFTSGRAKLLDNPKMISQFAALERRTFPTGRERIDPGPGHDDLANSAAIALSLAASKKQPWNISDAVLARFDRPMPRHLPNGGGQMKAYF